MNMRVRSFSFSIFERVFELLFVPFTPIVHTTIHPMAMYVFGQSASCCECCNVTRWVACSTFIESSMRKICIEKNMPSRWGITVSDALPQAL